MCIRDSRCPFLRQRQGQIDRRRAFADPALARGYSDDVLYALKRFQIALHGVRNDLEAHIGDDVGDAWNGRNCRNHRIPNAFKLSFRGVAKVDIH